MIRLHERKACFIGFAIFYIGVFNLEFHKFTSWIHLIEVIIVVVNSHCQSLVQGLESRIVKEDCGHGQICAACKSQGTHQNCCSQIQQSNSSKCVLVKLRHVQTFVQNSMLTSARVEPLPLKISQNRYHLRDSHCQTVIHTFFQEFV